MRTKAKVGLVLVLAIAIAVLALLLWQLPSYAQGHTQEEIDWLARAVAGETSVMGEKQRGPAGAWIVFSALNRVSNKWFPDNLVEVIKQGYHGARAWEHTLAPAWAYDVVYTTIKIYDIAPDLSRGALFVFGGQDLISCMDPPIVSIYRDGYVFSVHVYDRWPYSDACWREYGYDGGNGG